MKESLKNAELLGLTLKNIKTFEGHDTMTGFNADVYIDGKKAFHAFDSAYGGCYDFTPADSKTRHCDVSDVVQSLENKLKTLPSYKMTFGGKEREITDNLECVIGALISNFLNQKDLKRDSKKGILIETKQGYDVIRFKAGSITSMLKKYKQEQVAMMLQGHVKKYLKDKEVILNLEYLKSIGVKVD